MKILGNEIYIQRGETWSLDFNMTNDKGDPYMLFNQWNNPFLVITVTTATYKQEGDFRKTYWLDLSNTYVEQIDGSFVLMPIKKFVSTEALYLEEFTVEDVLDKYGTAVGGKIVEDPTSDFDVTNYLFYTDPLSDGNRVYKYVTLVDNEYVWVDYHFRIIKQFVTNDWLGQGYLFDIKVIAGESIKEHIAGILGVEATWLDGETQAKIDEIGDEVKRAEMQALFDTGEPLMPEYDFQSVILQPTRLYVSTNTQGGI